MIKCPTCGHDEPDSATRCGVCATALEGSRVAAGVLRPSRSSPGPAADAETRLGDSLPQAAATTGITPGQRFGQRYDIIRLLGVGGMGAVYHAWDSELGLSVALKVVLPGTDPAAIAELERRFKRELVLARQVTHPNVIRIHDLGEIDGIKYITMPFVQGTDLARLLGSAGRLAVPRALGFARQVAAGLRAAHEVGVVHRDLKPANILIDETEKAVITDFGIARSTDAATIATAAGAVVGTLAYMAPEQASGKPVDQRADIYAWGLIVYEMLVGSQTAGGNSALSLLLERSRQAPPALRTIDPSIPEPVERLVSKCLQPEAEARYQTVKELEADLDRLDENGHTRLAKPRAGLRWPITAAAAVLLALAGLAVWWALARPAAPPPPVAHEPVSVLIADFENQAGDPVFTGSLEQALSILIEGASFITAYPRTNARTLAAQLRPGAPLDENTALLVAASEAIRFVLTGVVASRGTGYELIVRAVDPASREVLQTATASVGNKAGVLQALESVASQLRSRLGDTTPESERAAQAETVRTASLEALHSYSLAQDLAARGRAEEAIPHYRKAIEFDEKFGRAYSGWATALYNLGRRDEAEKLWKQAVGLMDRMTEREKNRTLGTYYLGVSASYTEAIDTFEKLVQEYPADRAGQNNLALAYFYTLDFERALQHGKKAVEIYPKDTRARNNYALYLMYAGQFKEAAVEATEVLKQNPSQHKAYLPIAAAAFDAAKLDAMRDAYAMMAKTGPVGASLASHGLADLAMYSGRWSDAQTILEAGIAADEKANYRVSRASKLIALAEVHLAERRNVQAAASAREAIALMREDATLAPAAFVLLDAGRVDEARAIADELSQQFQPRSRAYGDMIQARIARAGRRFVESVEALQTSQKRADLWLGRAVLGVTNVEAGRHAEAIRELDRAAQRRGEAVAIFLDDVPTFRYLATLPYWTARAQQGLGNNAAAAEGYRAFLARRSAQGDPLADDARRRLEALASAAPAGAR